MATLKITPIKTDLFHPGMDIVSFILQQVPAQKWQEGLILAVTSKIVSLAENCLVPAGTDKKTLVEKESDQYLGEIGYGCHLTIKHGLLIPSAGIDESNSESGSYILYPQDPYKSAQQICEALKKATELSKLGVLITDSHTVALRRGVVGVALSFSGFEPVKNMIGHQDLFGRPLAMTQVNYADGLATAAVLMMGEADECCPLALLEEAPVIFSDKDHRGDIEIPMTEDLYFPLYRGLLEKEGQKN